MAAENCTGDGGLNSKIYRDLTCATPHKQGVERCSTSENPFSLMRRTLARSGWVLFPGGSWTIPADSRGLALQLLHKSGWDTYTRQMEWVANGQIVCKPLKCLRLIVCQSIDCI